VAGGSNPPTPTIDRISQLWTTFIAKYRLIASYNSSTVRRMKMAELKYAKYIVTEDVSQPAPAGFLKRMEEQRKAGNYIESTHMFRLSDSVAKGAFYLDCVWLWDKKGTEVLQQEIPHSHDFDEVWVFAGTVKDNPRELGGELEFWLEDEHYIVNKSCMVFVPRGLKHGPCGIRKIDKPIFFITAGNGTAYTRTSGNES
jgi:mannose-6-phosphate isomerase-like protein (cupin superfamily)